MSSTRLARLPAARTVPTNSWPLPMRRMIPLGAAAQVRLNSGDERARASPSRRMSNGALFLARCASSKTRQPSKAERALWAWGGCLARRHLAHLPLSLSMPPMTPFWSPLAHPPQSLHRRLGLPLPGLTRIDHPMASGGARGGGAAPMRRSTGHMPLPAPDHLRPCGERPTPIPSPTQLAPCWHPTGRAASPLPLSPVRGPSGRGPWHP
mmetsp:Transcript_9426/g.31308  ORF Transcript_9426/g.31308 Transcript_9426/m.31308 type:complete len:209 (+) Transcript_9426:148-774(+)|eukprot:scaffold32277_cov108-Isochrysis_galbana.AAC.1